MNENATKNAGFFTAINISCIILGCIFWSSFVSFWLNPDNIPTDSDGHLPPELMKNVQSMYTTMTLIQGIISLFGWSLISNKSVNSKIEEKGVKKTEEKSTKKNPEVIYFLL